VAASTAQAAALPLKGYLFVLMMAASLNFATPISYATNLMVYGPGGYRFGDFVRFGLPLQLLLGAVSCALCWLFWF
ncbi:MAG: SLC13 family permease, partial [Bacteroidales bacterium]